MSSEAGPKPQNAPAAQAQEAKREIIEFVKMIAWFLIVFFIVKTYVVEGYEVQGPSMVPTLHDHERILVLKLPHILSRFDTLSGINALKEGDIVVFDSPVEHNKRYVKRVIARGSRNPGTKTVVAGQSEGNPASADVVRVQLDHGVVYVNNRRVAEDYLSRENKTASDSSSEVLLPPGTYYVLGDNRGVSKDSRSFGPVDDDRLVGKAVLCFWPPSKIRLLR
jgi:signal peptidase I